MILLDTHAWIWWRNEPNQLSTAAQRALRKASRVAVSVVSVWEFTLLVGKRRLEVDRDPLEWIEAALVGIELTPLSPAICVRAMAFGAALHGDRGDRLIAATAIAESATLITRDTRLRDLPALVTLW